jgi:hypothetical protein
LLQAVDDTGTVFGRHDPGNTDFLKNREYRPSDELLIVNDQDNDGGHFGFCH